MSLRVKFSELVGKTLTKIDGAKKGSDMVVLTCKDGSEYRMSHSQDCCESVLVEDVCGDIKDLLRSKILKAEESTSDKNPKGANPEYQNDSFTWTFYRLRTIKGTVVIRWYGTSNGYYSERVDLERTA